MRPEPDRRVHSNPNPLVVAGLFAGIGGFELGFNLANHETEMLCEIDPAAQAVLRQRFRGVRLVSDIRKLGRLPKRVDVACAGFPCQDLSSTGHKNGIRGTNSSLVSELLRILRARPVRWVIVENVPFMLRLKKGQAIRSIVESLEALGYRWAYRVVDSQSFGVPHRRKRVYVVACLDGDPRSVLLSDDQGHAPCSVHEDYGRFDKPIGFYWTEGTYATGLAYDAVPPIKGGSTIGIPSPPAVLFPDGSVATPHICDAERLQGFDAAWTVPAESVVRASIRWRLIGNAVTVPVARWLAERLVSPSPYSDVDDTPFARHEPWPEAAWSFGGTRFKSGTSHYPLARLRTGLDGFLQHPVRPLSAKAASGFVRRARAGGLRFPPGFIPAIERHAVRMKRLGL